MPVSTMYRLILLHLLMLLGVVFPGIALADTIRLDFANVAHGSMTSSLIPILGVITVLSLAPAILMMVTSFTRIIIVLSFARTALGLQQTPPNIVLTSLALFLTFFIMTPTFKAAYDDGILPLMHKEMDEEQALPHIITPFHKFMLEHTRKKDLQLFTSIAKLEISDPNTVPLHALIPAFMLSELKRAFEIGFLIFLPFMIIDVIVSSVLMAMGMMMFPPAVLSLPLKLVFFVLVDGWHVLCESLVKSYIGS